VRTISRYLLLEFLRASAVALLAFYMLWIAVDSLLHIDELAVNAGIALRDVVLRSLDFVPIAVPIACTVGAVWSITRAAHFSEITAIRCGGLPLRSVLSPLLFASLLIGVLQGVFQDRVLIPAHGVLQNAGDETEESRRGPDQMLGRWWHTSPNFVFVAESFSAEQQVLQNVTVFRLDPNGRMRERIDAPRAEYKEGRAWELVDARVRSFPDQGGLEERTEARLRLDLDLTREQVEATVPVLEATTLRRLWRTVRDQPDNIAAASVLHGRLALLLVVLVLVLLAVPFAVGDTEGVDSLPRALLRSLIATSAFWGLWTAGLVSSQSGWIAPAVPIWGVTTLALAWGTWRFRSIKE
jgi:lipopolysaccharide export system permease protein